MDFPLEDVEACIGDVELLRRGEADLAGDRRHREDLEYCRRAALRAGTPATAEWVYFSSPDWTWSAECGREGWLLYDRATGSQHAFLPRAMS